MPLNLVKPCSDEADRTLGLLRDAARMQMGRGLDHDSPLMERVREKAEERYAAAQLRKRQLEKEMEALKQEAMLQGVGKLLRGAEAEEAAASLRMPPRAEELEKEIGEADGETRGVTGEDFDDALRDLEERGLLDGRGRGVALTSKGAELLGRGFLSRILLNLARRGLGAHRSEDAGYGSWAGPLVRPFELGDPYERIDVEKTLLAALQRGGTLGGLSVGDLRVREPDHATEVHFGILVDQSASMREKGKLEAAVETGLALDALTRLEYPEDRLRVYAFSEEVRRVEPWELTRLTVPQRYTDIRLALRAFRRAVAYEPGVKQAHLITDSAPNFLDGEFVGIKWAVDAVEEEARAYSQAEITLNVVMLDDDPELRGMAKRIAGVNRGRVLFADPSNLGEALVEDYVVSRRETLGA